MKIVLFTGAGASAQFDNPPTKEFKQSLLSKQKQVRLYKSLLDYKDFLDIEHVLECLKDIRTIHKMYSAKYLGSQDNKITVNDYPQISMNEIFGQYVGIERDIMFELFKAYKIDASYNELLRKFFGCLFEIITKHSNRIVLATTNYDMAIENFCRLEPKYTCIDGFKVAGDRFMWMPHLFDKSIENSTDIPVELLKIHGSLNWMDHGGGIEKSDKFGFEPTNEGHKNALISPILSTKEAETKEPFKTLLARFDNSLKESDVCIAIGSSFRDSTIAKRLKEFYESGKHLMIVSPRCYQNFTQGLYNNYEMNEGTCIEWAKQRAIQSNGRVSFIPLRVDKENNDEVFKEIEIKIKRVHV